MSGLRLELHVVEDGAVLDERPPGVEGDVAARTPLVVFVLKEVEMVLDMKIIVYFL